MANFVISGLIVKGQLQQVTRKIKLLFYENKQNVINSFQKMIKISISILKFSNFWPHILLILDGEVGGPNVAFTLCNKDSERFQPLG